MKKLFLGALLAAFAAAPLAACDYEKADTKADKAEISVKKDVSTAKATKAKATKSVASVKEKKAKI